ncbi:hypothetical protein ACFP81_03635 [Deinococcus lacus]|uniref:Phage holin family protein n=1 Tax=Deinococcus lacus TaxID=392561 RepID=A0ABW1YAP0_9DEIO
MNERERLIQKGFYTVVAMCVLLVLGRLLDVVFGLLGGAAEFMPLFMLCLTAWVAWNLYSGKLWARLVLGLMSMQGIVVNLIFILGGAVLGDFLNALPFIISSVVYGLTAFLLFSYEPVQEYLRYIGGET